MPRKQTKKIKGRKLNRNDLKREALRYFQKHDDRSLSARQLIKRLKIANDKNSVTKSLSELVKQKKLKEADGKYQLSGGPEGKSRTPKKTFTGTVDMTRAGDAYIICPDLAEDVFVRASDLADAMNGDSVEIELYGRRRGRFSGGVVRIVERTQDKFIGTYYAFKNYGIVIPDQSKVPFDIIVRKDQSHEASHGDKVVVRIGDWNDDKGKASEGEIVHVLGAPGSGEIEMQSILLMNGFDVAFPEEVMAEAKELPSGLSEKDMEGRRDMRQITTFTIDPATAKDFDDALSVNRLDNGEVEVGVHIADVTHFVKPGTEIDKEAYRRSTSVYLVDRVAPMLPEKLSNELCSLRPREESLCFSAIFTFDSKFNVRHRWFGKTVIFSDHRFAYEAAQEVMDAGEGPFFEELQLLNDIAHSLRDSKLKNGALTFETDEVQFVLDDEGVPVEIFTKERKDAHMLIEDFMLLANKEVARFIAETRRADNIPFVYRIHDHPDPDKLAELAMFARLLGFDMRVDTPRQISRSFNALAEAARHDETLQVLEPLAIRTMAKAEYNTENIGHYGLAFTFYTHFTSPIRRYSDVLVHRILFENIDGKTKRWNLEELSDWCKHISDMERRAQKAERDSIKYKQAEYMKQFIGHDFDGHISGMIDRGMFVKLDANHAEGMVQFSRLEEPYTLDSARMSATANHSGDVIKLGDQVRVKILDADPSKRQIEMTFI